MEYNWLQALEMVANGQPMHAPDENDNVYMQKIENGAICWIYKANNEYRETVRVSHKFVNATFELYHKQIELTEDEKVILRNLDGKYKYIARDEEGNNLCVFSCEPFKMCDIWNVIGEGAIHEVLEPFNHLFKGIEWEDEEPRLIADLIK